jgi:hypothetical protein
VPEKNFTTILALRLGFVSKAKRLAWLAAGLLAEETSPYLRRYGVISMTAKQIADAASIVYCRQVGH